MDAIDLPGDATLALRKRRYSVIASAPRGASASDASASHEEPKRSRTENGAGVYRKAAGSE